MRGQDFPSWAICSPWKWVFPNRVPKKNPSFIYNNFIDQLNQVMRCFILLMLSVTYILGDTSDYNESCSKKGAKHSSNFSSSLFNNLVICLMFRGGVESSEKNP